MRTYTSSTLLLLRLARRRIALGMAVAFCFLFWMGIVDSKSYQSTVAFVLLVGIGLTLLLRLHTILDNTVFPVTNRQLAWIPMGVWAMVTLSGFAGITLGRLTGFTDSNNFLQTNNFLLESACYWSALTFLYLIIWRVVQINRSHVWVLPMSYIYLSKAAKTYEDAASAWADRLIHAWPLWMLGCGFLLYEAPRLTAALRRLEHGDGSWLDSMNQKAWLQSPVRPAAVSCIANAMTGILLAAVATCYLVVQLELSASLSNLTTTIKSHWPIPLFMGFFLLWTIRILWQTNRASGLTRSQALRVLLLELTIVGYAFRDRLGVARGAIGECVHCGNPRMAWHTQCPHCGDGLPTTAPEISVATDDRTSRYRTAWQNDPGALIFRRVIPVYLFIAILAVRFEDILNLLTGQRPP